MGYFLACWSDFVASFINEPMDINTEQNSVSPVDLPWYHANPKAEVRRIEKAVATVESGFRCGLCDDGEHTSLNNGV
jgi:hypothetical protein